MPSPITPEQVHELDELFLRANNAMNSIAHYDQARVDRLCQAVAWSVSNKKTFEMLSNMGIRESGLGDPVTRPGKRFKIRGILRDVLRQKSIGIIEDIPEKGISKYAKPAGIVASLVPTTNPDLTPGGQAVFVIKAKDAIIFSPHPRSKNTTFETVRIMREALAPRSAPDILQCIRTGASLAKPMSGRIVIAWRRPFSPPTLRYACVLLRSRKLDEDL